MWTVISSPLIEMVRNERRGVKLTSAITRQRTEIIRTAYVDNVDLIEMNEDKQMSIENQYDPGQDLQDLLKIWDNALRTTGGGLSPEKSFWKTSDSYGGK